MRSFATALICMIVLAPHAGAERLGNVICDDSARLELQLIDRHGARKMAQGLRGPDAILEVWVTPDSGDWTLVQTYANGTSCIVAMGEAWDAILPATDPA